MCGIAGCYPLDRYTRAILPHLAWDMEERGDDSWGITNGTAIYKSLGPVTGSYKIPHTFQPGDAVTLHTRAASVGKVSLENQHPFTCYGTEKTIIGVHNGGVSNHKELAEYVNKKLKELDPNAEPFTYDVDSHALYMYLACGGPPNIVRGTGALVWWERAKDSTEKVLNLLRFNTQALHVVKLDNGALVWCSTADPLQKAARMVGLKIVYNYDIKGDTLYQIQPDTVQNQPITSGYPLVTVGPMVFGGAVGTGASFHRHQTGHPWDDDWHSWQNYSQHSQRNYSSNSPAISNIDGIIRISRHGEYSIHDTAKNYDKEKAIKNLVFGSPYGNGLAKKCAICEGSYDKDTYKVSFVLRTKSDFVCARCVDEAWTETLEAMAIGEVPLVLGISVGYSAVGDVPEILLEPAITNTTNTTETGENNEHSGTTPPTTTPEKAEQPEPVLTAPVS